MNYLNDAIIKEILISNPNFSALTYQDNTLEFESEVINLDNFSLVEIFGPYSELKEDVKKEDMTANDLFEIIKINVTLKSINNPNNETSKLNILEYQSILESEEITQIDEDNLIAFYDFLNDLYKYSDYLCEDSVNYLTSYENYILNLMLRDNLNSKQQEAISKYDAIANIKKRSEEINIENINRLNYQARRAKRAGYANSLLIVEIVILVTFTLSSFIFLWLFNK